MTFCFWLFFFLNFYITILWHQGPPLGPQSASRMCNCAGTIVILLGWQQPACSLLLTGSAPHNAILNDHHIRWILNHQSISTHFHSILANNILNMNEALGGRPCPMVPVQQHCDQVKYPTQPFRNVPDVTNIQSLLISHRHCRRNIFPLVFHLLFLIKRISFSSWILKSKPFTNVMWDSYLFNLRLLAVACLRDGEGSLHGVASIQH